MMRRYLSWCLFVLAMVVGFAFPAFAQEGEGIARPPVHVEVILDSSGSMLDNDPSRLSALAGMIFADLAAPGDHLGVLSMKRPRYSLRELTRVDGEREGFRKVVRTLPFHGTTDCGGPLQKAADELAELKKKEPSARQFVIFLSDGLCPQKTDVEKAAVAEKSQRLASQGVKVFAIGLFDDVALQERDQERDLKRMKELTDGEYFRARRASDLPRRFAEILGKIVGSEALDLEFTPGKATRVELDGYVADAMLIVTSNERPVRITGATAPDGAKLKLPVKDVPYAAMTPEYFVSAADNGKGRYYTVLRVPRPQAGEWSFIISGPPGAQALLIQNYALDPVIALAPEQDTYRTGVDELTVSMTLRGPDGKPLDDAAFMKKVEAELVHVTPDGESAPLEVAPLDDGRLAAKVKFAVEGLHRFEGRVSMKKGGLNKSARTRNAQAVALRLALGEGQGPVDFGQLKAGQSTDDLVVDLSGSELEAAYPLAVKLDAGGLAVDPTTVTISPGHPKAKVTFHAAEDHSGGVVQGVLTFTYGGQSVDVEVRGEVLPITFWEKYGGLIMTILAGILLLLLILFIVYGIISPHAFPNDAQISFGRDLDRLKKNHSVIREIPGTGRGFYRNAKLLVGGPTSFLSDGQQLAVIEAVGPGRMEITAEKGVTLEKVSKFDPSKTDVVGDGKSPVHQDQIFKLGELYIRIR